MTIREYLKKKKILCDGAFGTYFHTLCGTDMLPEAANTQAPELVRRVHTAYLKAGAELLRTNTFASHKLSLRCGDEELSENIRRGYELAREAAGEYLTQREKQYGDSPSGANGGASGREIYVAGDIGPIPGTALTEEEERQRQNLEEYRRICGAFLKAGADILLFETFSDMEEILPVIRELKAENPGLFLMVQFCVNQQGYTNTGRSAVRLLAEAARIPEIDSIGLNCGVGPGHLQQIIKDVDKSTGKYLTALPNAGYPKLLRSRMVFLDNQEYFVSKMAEIAASGADIVGGCCGTTPDYIAGLAQSLSFGRKQACPLSAQAAARVTDKRARVTEIPPLEARIKNSAFYRGKEKKKLVAVELSPPLGADAGKVMAAAELLADMEVDAATFPDSPSGRTRADSILVGLKAMEKTSLCVMPHICCRDRNAIAIRSQLLGAYINGIRNLLVVTGDPIPTMIRQEVKGVFNFDSVGMMKILRELNQEEFAADPMVYGGAVNYSRPDLTVELRRITRKMEAGASFFLTQPVFTREDVERVRDIRSKTHARILCGIMPLVSRKNALFMKNEMTGIPVTEELVARFDGCRTREDGERVGVAMAAEVMEMAGPFVDGFYFSLPFNRVYLLKQIQELPGS